MEHGMFVPTAKTGSAIQTVIDQAHGAGGGVVFLPAGDYTLDSALHLKSNVSLVGAGASTVLTMSGPVNQAKNRNFIELEGGGTDPAHDIKISKLAIRGPGSTADLEQDVSDTPVQGCGILASDREVHNVVIRACRIERVSGCGIYFHSPAPKAQPMKDIVIEDCRLHDNKRPAEGARPGNNIENGLDAYKDIVFKGLAFENIRIEGNVCSFAPTETNAYGNDSGIAFVENSDQHTGFVRNVRLVGNACSGHRRHGLATHYDTLDADWVFVSDNRCENNGWMGIYINTKSKQAADTRMVVSGNYCCNNGFVGNDGGGAASIRGGIVVNNADNLVLSNNICMDNGKPGSAFTEHGVVAGTNAKHASGIRIRGKKIVVQGNLLQGNRGSGVSMWPGRASEVSIVNNRAVQNRRKGIEVIGVPGNPSNQAHQVVVMGNLCTGNTEQGLHISSTQSGLVASNYVANNGISKIFKDGSSANVSVQANVDA